MLKLQKLEQILLFLTLLFLPTQLGKHFWPEFSFIYSLPIDYLSPTLYFWDLLVVGLLIIWILRRPKINRLALNLLLIFLLTQTVSLVGAENFGAGLVRLEQYILVGGLGVYIASAKWEALSAKLYLPLSLAILGESGLAIAQFLKGGTIGLWILGERTFSISTPAIAKFDFQGIQFLRPYGTFPHPNVLAAFMVIVILLLLFRRRLASRSGQESNNKLFYGSLIRSGMTGVVMFLAGLTTLVTFSRTVMLAGVVAAFILLNSKGRFLLLLGIVLLLPILYARFSSLLNFDNLTLLRREELSLTAFSIWQSSPIFGVGLNNFIPAASNELLSGPSRFLQPVHNIFLLSLAETGVLGFLGLLGLLGYPIIMLFKLRTILLIWGVIIFLGLFDHYFLTLPQGYRLLFLIWGLSLSRSVKQAMLELKNASPS